MTVRTTQISPSVVQADREVASALKDLSDYKPHNPEYSLEVVQGCVTIVDDLIEREARARRTLESIRDARQDAEVKLHNLVCGVKVEVKAQYGPDSDEIQALGLKKLKDYKRPTREKSKP